MKHLQITCFRIMRNNIVKCIYMFDCIMMCKLICRYALNTTNYLSYYNFFVPIFLYKVFHITIVVLYSILFMQDPVEPSHVPAQMLTHANNIWRMLMLAENELDSCGVSWAFRGSTVIASITHLTGLFSRIHIEITQQFWSRFNILLTH